MEEKRKLTTSEEELKKVWEAASELFPAIPIEHPLILELVEALGYDNCYDALKATVKEKGLWKEEWDKNE